MRLPSAVRGAEPIELVFWRLADRRLGSLPSLRVYVRLGSKERRQATPIELPTDYEFAINLKAGKTLGVAIPQSLVLRADKVIEQSNVRVRGARRGRR